MNFLRLLRRILPFQDGASHSNQSLGTRLWTLLSLAIAAVTFLQITFISLLIERTVGPQPINALAQVSAQASSELDGLIGRHYNQLALLASLDVLEERSLAPQALVQLLELARQSSSEYRGIGVLNPDGSLSIGSGETTDASAGNLLPVNLLEPVRGTPPVGFLKLLPAADGRAEPLITLSFPLRTQTGVLSGVLIAWLRWPWTPATTATARQLLPSGTEVLVTDDSGRILAGTPSLVGQRLAVPSVTAAARGGPGTNLEVWPDGTSYLVAYHSGNRARVYPGERWTVLARQPASEATAFLLRLRTYIAAGLCSLAIVLIALSAGLVEMVYWPIRHLAAAATQITLEDAPAQLTVPPGSGEAAELSIALNHLLGQTTRQGHHIAVAETSLREERSARLSAEAEVVQRSQQLGALWRATSSLCVPQQIDVLHQLICEEAVRVLNIRAAALWVLRPGSDDLELGGISGLAAESIGGAKAKLDLLPPDLLRRSTWKYYHEQLVAGRRPALAAAGIEHVLALPLRHETRLIGVLVCLSAEDTPAPDSQQLTLMRSVADLATLALAHAFLTEGCDTAIACLAKSLDLRDAETGSHAQRTAQMALRLAAALGLGNDALVHIQRGSLLHDIGKLGVGESILLKPGPLDAAEWQVMRRHPTYAYEILAPIDYLRPALNIPYLHHERWDGQGYPLGLVGEQIPLEARIFAVIEMWDAMMTAHPYRKALSEDEAIAEIAAAAGSALDPTIVNTFLKLVSIGEMSRHEN